MTKPDPQLLSRLRAIDQRRRSVLLLSGAADSLVVFLLSLGLFCLLDWCLQLPFPVRIGLAGSLYLGVGWHAWRRWIRSWLEPFSPEEAAWRIESQCPELHEELISAVDFSRGDHARGSRALIERVLEQALVDADKIQASSTFPIHWRQLRWPAILLVGFLVATSIPQLQLPQLLARTLVPASDDATVGLTTIEITGPRTTTVVEGTPITISARHNDAEIGDLRVVVVADDSRRRLPMTYDFDSGLYQIKLNDLRQPVQYWVESGRIRSRAYRLRVVPLPRVRDFEIGYDYPDYADRPNRTENSTTADLRGLVGTIATVTVTASKPLASGRLRITPDNSTDSPFEIPGSIVGDTGRLRFQIPLRQKADFVITMVDEDQLSPSLSPVYRIRAHPDKPPTIEFLAPAEDHAVAPATNLEIAWLAQDDFGVAKVELALRINDRRQPPLPLAADAAGSRLDLARYSLATGDVLELELRAYDALGQMTASPPRLLDVLAAGEHDERHPRFFSAADKLALDLHQLREAMPELEAMHDELASIINLAGIDRAHYEARYAEQLDRIATILATARTTSDELAAAAFFPRAKGYGQLLSRYFEQEQFGSVVRLRATSDRQAIVDLAMVPELALELTAATAAKGRQAFLSNLANRSIIESRILIKQLPDNAPRLANLANRIDRATTATDDLPEDVRAPLPVDNRQPAAIGKLLSHLRPVYSDYGRAEAAATAVRDRLRLTSQRLLELADRYAVHAESKDGDTLKQLAKDLKADSRTAATARERLDHKALAEVIDKQLQNQQPARIKKAAAALAAIERHEKLLAAENHTAELVAELATALTKANDQAAKAQQNAVNHQLASARRLNEHLLAAAANLAPDDAKQLAGQSRDLEDALAHAANPEEAQRALLEASKHLENLQKRFDRVARTAAIDARRARRQLGSEASTKAEQAMAAANTTRQLDAKSQVPSPAIDQQLADLQRQLTDEAATSAGPLHAPGGAREKDALAAAVQDVRENVAAATDEHALDQAANQLDQLAGLLAKHDAAANHQLSLAEAKTAHDDILEATNASPGQTNHAEVSKAAIARAARTAAELADEARGNIDSDNSALAQKTAQLSARVDQLRQAPAPAAAAPETTNSNQSRADQFFEDLDQADHLLAEAASRKQRHDDLTEAVAAEQNAARRLLEETLERRLPAQLNRELARRHEDFNKHPDNPNHQANILNDAARQLKEFAPAAAEAIQRQVDPLKSTHEDAQKAKNDADRIQQLSDGAGDRIEQASRRIARNAPPETAGWVTQTAESLQDNLANENLAAAQQNLDALQDTFTETAEPAPQNPVAASATNAADALDKALAVATDATRPKLQEAAEALAAGDLAAAQQLAAEVAAERQEEITMGDALVAAQKRSADLENLRHAEQQSNTGRFAAAAFAAKEAGATELAEQLREAQDSTSRAIESIHQNASAANERHDENELRQAANELAHNNSKNAEKRLANNAAAEPATKAALATAKERGLAAQQAATNARQQAENATALEQARAVARQAAAALHAQASQNEQAAKAASRTDQESAQALSATAAEARERAANLQALANADPRQASARAAERALQPAAPHAAAAEAAAQLATAMTQPPPGQPGQSAAAQPSPSSPAAQQLNAAAAQLAAAQQALADGAPATSSLDSAATTLASAAAEPDSTAQASASPQPAQATVADPKSPAGPSGPAGESSSASPGDSAAIGDAGQAADVAAHTWAQLWQETKQTLDGEATRGSGNTYNDYYRKANQHYLSRLAAESRKRQLRAGSDQ